MDGVLWKQQNLWSWRKLTTTITPYALCIPVHVFFAMSSLYMLLRLPSIAPQSHLAIPSLTFHTGPRQWHQWRARAGLALWRLLATPLLCKSWKPPWPASPVRLASRFGCPAKEDPKWRGRQTHASVGFFFFTFIWYGLMMGVSCSFVWLISHDSCLLFCYEKKKHCWIRQLISPSKQVDNRPLILTLTSHIYRPMLPWTFQYLTFVCSGAQEAMKITQHECKTEILFAWQTIMEPSWSWNANKQGKKKCARAFTWPVLCHVAFPTNRNYWGCRIHDFAGARDGDRRLRSPEALPLKVKALQRCAHDMAHQGMCLLSSVNWSLLFLRNLLPWSMGTGLYRGDMILYAGTRQGRNTIRCHIGQHGSALGSTLSKHAATIEVVVFPCNVM
jgi:hypothetical protein